MTILILGDVTTGKNCWIGPNVVLDGSGGELHIGDHVDISAGVQIYTHDTVKRALSGGTAKVEYAPTRIGSRVYIGPQSVIEKGVTIGDGVVIGAMSLVKGMGNTRYATVKAARPRRVASGLPAGCHARRLARSPLGAPRGVSADHPGGQ